MNMRLETVYFPETDGEGIEKHLVRVYLPSSDWGEVCETVFSVTHDKLTDRLWITYNPERIEIEKMMGRDSYPKETTT